MRISWRRILFECGEIVREGHGLLRRNRARIFLRQSNPVALRDRHVNRREYVASIFRVYIAEVTDVTVDLYFTPEPDGP